MRRVRGARRRRTRAVVSGRSASNARRTRGDDDRRAGVRTDSCTRCRSAFADLGAAQCGYCTPGMLVTAKALLDREPAPVARRGFARRSRATCAAAPATCRSSRPSRRRRTRCAERRQARGPDERADSHHRPRHGGASTRAPRSPARRASPTTSCCRACCTASCSARPIRTRASSRIDTSKAAAHPGVHLVLTGDAFPIPYGVLPVSHDEHALCRDKVRFVGDPVAAVIAARRGHGRRRASTLIDVDVRAAADVRLARGQPRPPRAAHPRLRRRRATSTRRRAAVRRRRCGARRAPIDVFDDVFFFEGNTHLPLEQHAAVAAEGSRRQARRLFEHADAALPAPGAGQGARDAGRAHPRDRHAERRRVRRQERSVQPRDRGRESRAACSIGRSSSV